MGAVYLAKRLDSAGEPVAIKVLTLSSARDRFENEARVLLNLKSPHTVRVLELGRTEDGAPFLVMEHLAGRTLSDAMDEGDLCDRRILEVLRDVCASLEEAHGMGLIHRDLKPSNIYLQRVAGREYVRVLDFGIAKLVNGTAKLQVPLQAISSPTRGPIGSPPFMAPEQCRGEQVSDRTDLFALGLIAYLAFSGKPAYKYRSGEPNAVLFTHASDLPRPLEHDRRGLPIAPALRELVSGLLAVEPEARLGPAGRVRTRIEALLETEAPNSLSARPPQRHPRVRGGARPSRAPIRVPATAAALAIAGLAWMRFSARPPPTETPAVVPVAPEARASAPEPGPETAGARAVRPRETRATARPRETRAAARRRSPRVLSCEDLSGRTRDDPRAALGAAIDLVEGCLRRSPVKAPDLEVRFRWRGEQAFFRVVGAPEGSTLAKCVREGAGRVKVPAQLRPEGGGGGVRGMVFLSCRFRTR